MKIFTHYYVNKQINNKTSNNISFKANTTEPASYARGLYNRLKKNILSTVTSKEYNERKQYILDCMSDQKELDKEKFFEKPTDRKKNSIILNDVIEEVVEKYIGAAKSRSPELANENSKINKDMQNCYDFWNKKISKSDKDKYIHINGDDNCQKQFGINEEEWIYVSKHYQTRKTGLIKSLMECCKDGTLFDLLD